MECLPSPACRSLSSELELFGSFAQRTCFSVELLPCSTFASAVEAALYRFEVPSSAAQQDWSSRQSAAWRQSSAAPSVRMASASGPSVDWLCWRRPTAVASVHWSCSSSLEGRPQHLRRPRFALICFLLWQPRRRTSSALRDSGACRCLPWTWSMHVRRHPSIAMLCLLLAWPPVHPCLDWLRLSWVWSMIKREWVSKTEEVLGKKLGFSKNCSVLEPENKRWGSI